MTSPLSSSQELADDQDPAPTVLSDLWFPRRVAPVLSNSPAVHCTAPGAPDQQGNPTGCMAPGASASSSAPSHSQQGQQHGGLAPPRLIHLAQGPAVKGRALLCSGHHPSLVSRWPGVHAKRVGAAWPVPEPVIRTMAATLADEAFGPGRSEGFASAVAVPPTHQTDLSAFLRGELARLNRRISAACNRQHQLRLHGHSRRHRRVRLVRHPAHLEEGRAVEIRIWPLQLILSGGFWHLAWEDDAIGRPHGLLQCERLELSIS